MLLFENISLALSGLLANKMRALLTMLGIIIGIGSVIAIMTVGNSLTNSVTDSMQGMGANNITVMVTSKSDADADNGLARMFREVSPGEDDLLMPDMIAEYCTEFNDDIYAVTYSESVTSNYDVTINGNTAPVDCTGVNNEYAEPNDINLLYGRFLSDSDQDKKRCVAVVSDLFCRTLYPEARRGTEYLGKSFDMTVGTRVYTFYIVGVYEYEASQFSFGTSSDKVDTSSMYIPISTAKRINGSSEGFASITVIGATTADTTALLQQTNSFFASFYTRNDSFTAEATSLQSLMDEMTSMMSTISLAISIIAGISLLVGGIGVMNIMLVSITERTREIGTRKALGATNGSIRVQFIVESVIICLVGGIIGILVGLGLGALGAKLLGYAASPSVHTILVAVLFSMSIGVFFGYYPANKAAKMDPIEALRYE